MIRDAKNWVFTMWIIAGLMWCVFAWLYFWIRYRRFGLAFLLLGLLAFFIALRWRRQHARRQIQG